MSQTGLVRLDGAGVLGTAGEAAGQLEQAGTPSSGFGIGAGASPIDAALAAGGAADAAAAAGVAAVWLPRGPQQQAATGSGVAGIEGANADAAASLAEVGTAADARGVMEPTLSC